MNRHQRRALQKDQHAHVKSLPENLEPIDPDEFPNWQNAKLPVKAWKSRKYLVQQYEAESTDYPDLIRLSVCRVQTNTNLGWKDQITWEELQSIKREVGFGTWYGVEIYPPDQYVVNVANFRHLWLLPKPLDIGWVG